MVSASKRTTISLRCAAVNVGCKQKRVVTSSTASACACNRQLWVHHQCLVTLYAGGNHKSSTGKAPCHQQSFV